jgi:hypothetical protein
MVKVLFGMIGRVFLGLGMISLALVGLMAILVIVGLLFADKILQMIF